MTVGQAVSPPTALGPAPGGARRDRERFQWSSVLLLTPAFLLLVVLFLIPVGYAVYLGLTNITLIGVNATSWSFTGLSNLQRLVGDSTFLPSVAITAIFLGGSVVGVVVLGLGLALLLQRGYRPVRIVVGGIVVVVFMLPAITAGMTWYASTTSAGTFAGLLHMSRADFLDSAPLLVVTLANVWSQTGFAMLIFRAALRNIPSELMEAAVLERASPIQCFRRITLPLLSSSLRTTVLLVALMSLSNFALIYIMTAGGPNGATNILPIDSYQQAFVFSNLGYGALIGNVMVLLVTILGVIYVRTSRRA
jgi:multiple sugar transport system permease protein